MAGGKRQAKTKKKAPAKAAKTTARASKPATRAKPAPRARPKARPATSAARSRSRTPAKGSAVDKLHQVALTATNLDASVAFYRDILGLKFIARFDPPGLAFFALGGGARLMLSATASEATLYFLVDNLKAAHRDLQKRGVQFLQPPAMIHHDEAGDFGKKGAEEWMAFFRDPAGNTLALVEKR